MLYMMEIDDQIDYSPRQAKEEANVREKKKEQKKIH